MYSQELLNKAQAGDTNSMIQLGYDYYYGTGITANYNEALHWMEKAVWCGAAKAGRQVSWLIMNSNSKSKNYKDAFYYAYHAMLVGDPEATLMVGFFFDGKGGGNVVPVNYYTANHFYRLSLNKNCAPAAVHLARNYLEGRGDLKSPDKAIECLKKGAELGNADSMELLGNIYEGAWEGAARNDNLAGYWYNEASQKGSDFARDRMRNYRYSSLTKRWKRI